VVACASGGGLPESEEATRASQSTVSSTTFAENAAAVEEDVVVVPRTLEGEAVADDGDVGNALGGLLLGASLVSPFFFWGTSMVAMKDVLAHTSPLFVSTARLLPAGLTLIGVASALGREQPRGWRAWGAVGLFAAIDATLFQAFLSEGLQRTSAGLGSVIIDSQPLTVAILAAIFYGESIGVVGAVGLLVGVLGLCLLELPPSAIGSLLHLSAPVLTDAASTATTAITSARSSDLSLTDSLLATNWFSKGEFWMLLAAQSMAVGTVMVRWVAKFVDPVMATGWHMFLGGLPLLALAVTAPETPEHGAFLEMVQGLTARDYFLMAYVSLFGGAAGEHRSPIGGRQSGCWCIATLREQMTERWIALDGFAGYGIFFYNAQSGNLTKLSSLTFLTPMFAALFGYLLLGETLNNQQLFGALVTLSSIYLVTATPAGDADDA